MVLKSNIIPATILGLALCGTAAPVEAGNNSIGIFVAGYDGWVRTVSLSNNNGTYSLTEVEKNEGCKDNPTWLSYEGHTQRLWCLDEGLKTGYGTLNTFTVQSGHLMHYQRRRVSASPVHSKFLNSNSKIVTAQYGGPSGSGIRGGVIVHDIANGELTTSLNYTFEALQQAGPAERQDVPRAQGVTLDPTNKWLTVTDFGADLIRTFRISDNNTLVKGVEMGAVAGSGPRHAVFGTTSTNSTHLFVVTENTNTITTYNVTYDDAGMHLSAPSRVIDTFGGNATKEVLAAANAAEIQISPDNKFVMVSNRVNETYSEWNSIATYRIQPDGSLAFVQLVSVGGLGPRHFKLNLAGDKVLVALTASSKITVLSRDVATGKIIGTLATLDIDTKVVGESENAGIPAAVWYE